MNDSQRLSIAAVCAFVINVGIVALPWPHEVTDVRPEEESLLFNITPAPPEEDVPPQHVPQVIETNPTEQAPDSRTALRSDKTSIPADTITYEGDAPAPRLEEMGDWFALPKPAGAEAQPSPPTPPLFPPAPETPPEDAPSKETETQPEDAPPKETETQPEDAPPKETETQPEDAPPEAAEEIEMPVAPEPAEDAIQVTEAPGEEPAPPEKEKEPEPAAPPKQLAKRMPPHAPQPATEAPQRGQGDVEGMAVEEGVAAFAALRDEVAAYILQLKPMIRRSWLTLLLTRYSGTSPTEATVKVVIAPDGTLVAAELMDSAEDRIYAALCRQAVRNAGPFPPFPFEIPREYRGENLVIRWTFGFL
ncbi:MAG: TonB C-terminal domain-containing protein [Candidatus Hydrogenedentota bacterium]